MYVYERVGPVSVSMELLPTIERKEHRVSEVFGSRYVEERDVELTLTHRSESAIEEWFRSLMKTQTQNELEEQLVKEKKL